MSYNVLQKKTATRKKINDARKDDALELAYLIYDIFKEETENDDKIEDGQNNAKQPQNS